MEKEKVYSYFVVFNHGYYPVVSTTRTIVYTNKQIITHEDFRKFQIRLEKEYFKTQMREPSRLEIESFNYLGETTTQESDGEFAIVNPIDILSNLEESELLL